MVRPGSKVKYQNRIVTVDDVEKSGREVYYVLSEGCTRFTVRPDQIEEIFNEGNRHNENAPLYS